MKKGREPGAMPQDIRLAYGKILSLMLLSEPYSGINGMVEFYRALHELNLKERDRRAVLEFMIAPDTDGETLCRLLMAIEDPEERNLVRFTLLEDLYRMMMADHYEGDQEVAFLILTAGHLAVRQEHVDQVRVMYENGGIYPTLQEGESPERRILRNLAAGTAGVAVPLLMVSKTGHPGLKPAGVVTGLMNLNPGKKRPSSLMPGLIITVATGALAWQSIQWLLRLPEWRRRWMVNRLRRSGKKQLMHMEKQLDKDIQMIRRLMNRDDSAFMESDSRPMMLELLRRTRAMVQAEIRRTGRMSGKGGEMDR